MYVLLTCHLLFKKCVSNQLYVNQNRNTVATAATDLQIIPFKKIESKHFHLHYPVNFHLALIDLFRQRDIVAMFLVNVSIQEGGD